MVQLEKNSAGRSLASFELVKRETADVCRFNARRKAKVDVTSVALNDVKRAMIRQDERQNDAAIQLSSGRARFNS